MWHRSPIVNRCVPCFCSRRYVEDLDEGIYIQQTVESVLLNNDGKQLMVRVWRDRAT